MRRQFLHIRFARRGRAGLCGGCADDPPQPRCRGGLSFQHDGAWARRQSVRRHYHAVQRQRQAGSGSTGHMVMAMRFWMSIAAG